MSDDQAVYPIRTVAELTGVNPVTLRAWERRYGLIKPQRTAKGHRLYTEADIARIRRILQLLDRGVRISRAREALAAEESGQRIAAGEDPWPAWRAHLDRVLARFDPNALEGALGELLSLYPVDRAASHVLLPALAERQEAAPEAVAEGYLLARYLRGRLGSLLQRQRQRPRHQGMTLLLASPPGDGLAPPLTETALCTYALTALHLGHRPLLLGEGVPAAAITAGAQRACADAVLLYAGAVPTASWHQAIASLAAELARPLGVAGAVTQGSAPLPAGVLSLAGDPHEAIAHLQSHCA